MKSALTVFLLLLIIPCGHSANPPEYRWFERDIDTINIGYGLQLEDVNGDDRIDIILADQRTIQWYQYPTWDKHVIAKHLTLRDNVCVTARDIDGDGKCEIAVGAGWNFKETLKDGAVFYLHPPEDRTQLWEPIQLYNEPNTHRMHWVKGAGDSYSLLVKPLRGRGSVDGVGPGLRLMEYIKPVDPKGKWEINLINDFLHLSHNFHPVNWDDDPEEEVIIAAKEGVWFLDRVDGEWVSTQITKDFAGEIRDGVLPGGRRFIATIEPMHGVKSAVYLEPEEGETLWPHLSTLSDELIDGHALAIDDFLGVGSDQVVVGWRAMHPEGTPGIEIFTPLDKAGKSWRRQTVSAEKLAVEDIKSADLNGDGKADFVAAGRQTKNLKIFFSK
ncbi:MAG: VCBS repeat-containing protein [Verrucomicrobiales bacterium]|nr:VCBS repeat-containing protein [Verrucomicrobiales bacterium]